MAARDLPTPKDWVLPGHPTIEGGYEAARRLLTHHPQISALFAYNDLSALGAVQACHELGRSVPGGCAIIGFDDIRLAAMVSPSLTSVRVNKYELGQQAMMRLLTMLEEPDAILPPIRVEVELMVRESTQETEIGD
jgi:LacI family transcriptional regulator